MYFQLKTNRQRNAERLLRQGAKWEREHVMYDEQDRQREHELHEKHLADLALEEDYTKANQLRGMDLIRSISMITLL